MNAFGLVPALEHIDHLEVDVVIVRRRHLLWPKRRNEADDVSPRHTAGCLCYPEIAVLGVCAQSLIEIGFAVMADGEFVFRPRLRAVAISPSLTTAR